MIDDLDELWGAAGRTAFGTMINLKFEPRPPAVSFSHSLPDVMGGYGMFLNSQLNFKWTRLVVSLA